jgi:hypothetical protein
MKLAIFALVTALACTHAGWAQAELPTEQTNSEDAVWVSEEPKQPGVLPGSPSFGWGQYGIGFETAESESAQLTAVEPASGPK